MKEGVKTSSFDLLSGVRSNESPLYASLYGTKRALSVGLGLKTVPIVQHDYDKRILSNEGGSRYPYAFIRLTSLRIEKENQNLKQIKRSGAAIQAQSNVDTLQIFKGYLFPSVISCELVFYTDAVLDALNYIQKLAILSATDSLSFEVKVPNISPWQVSVFFESDDFSIPTSILEDEENPKALELTYPFTIKTKLGIIKEVSKVNNEGRIEQSIVPGSINDAE